MRQVERGISQEKGRVDVCGQDKPKGKGFRGSDAGGQFLHSGCHVTMALTYRYIN